MKLNFLIKTGLIPLCPHFFPSKSTEVKHSIRIRKKLVVMKTAMEWKQSEAFWNSESIPEQTRLSRLREGVCVRSNQSILIFSVISSHGGAKGRDMCRRTQLSWLNFSAVTAAVWSPSARHNSPVPGKHVKRRSPGPCAPMCVIGPVGVASGRCQHSDLSPQPRHNKWVGRFVWALARLAPL